MSSKSSIKTIPVFLETSKVLESLRDDSPFERLAKHALEPYSDADAFASWLITNKMSKGRFKEITQHYVCGGNYPPNIRGLGDYLDDLCILHVRGTNMERVPANKLVEEARHEIVRTLIGGLYDEWSNLNKDNAGVPCNF